MPTTDLAKCPKCDRWNWLQDVIICKNCGSVFLPKQIWQSTFTLDSHYRLVFNLGKFKGKPIKNYPQYLEWMLSQDFDLQSKEIIKKVLYGDKDD